jgi:hypothetical protein
MKESLEAAASNPHVTEHFSYPPYSSTMVVEAEGSSRTLVTVYKIVQCHIQEVSDLHSHCNLMT